MTLRYVGLALLVAWPLYNAALVIVGLRGTRPGPRHRAPVMSPRLYWIVVPCLNEAEVVHGTITAALALTVPGARVEVLAIDDGSSDGTAEILGMFLDPRLHVLRRRLPDARCGKGTALNAACAHAREWAARRGIAPGVTVIGVLDGDGRATSATMSEVAAFFRDGSVGAVQCRIRIRNRQSVIAAMQDLEFGVVVNAAQILRDRLGSTALGGNGQFVRLSALDRLDSAPWNGSLVEDLDLGLRLHLAGVRVRYASGAVVDQQGLADLRRLVRQRTRWAQGNLQCLRYVPRLIASRRISNPALFDFLHYLLAPWLTLPALVGLGAAVAIEISWAPWVLPLPATVWLAATLAAGLVWSVVYRVQVHGRRAMLVGSVWPGLLLAGVIATACAAVRLVLRRTAWAKTERFPERLARPVEGIEAVA